MPTLDYSFSNTPPTAVPTASQVPSNAAPGAVALAATAGTGAAPAAVPFTSQTPNNGAPAAVPRASQTPNNAAPGAVAFASMAGTAAQPAAVALASQVPSNAAPAAVALTGVALDNTAPGAIALASSAPSNAAPGAVPVGATNGLNDTPRPIGYTPPLTPLKDDNVNSPILKIEGALALNSTYGQTRIPTASALERVQLALESAPLTGPATITLVDAAGVSYGVSVTVLAGETFGETIPGAPVALPAGSNIRAKCTATPGGNDPGAYGVVTLFTRLAA